MSDQISIDIRVLVDAFDKADNTKKTILFEHIIERHVEQINFAQQSAMEIGKRFRESTTEIDASGYGLQLINCLENIEWHVSLILQLYSAFTLPHESIFIPLTELLKKVKEDKKKVIEFLQKKSDQL
jgi:hypothetical protein